MNKKKVILGLAAAGTALAMLPLFAAFEAHAAKGGCGGEASC